MEKKSLLGVHKRKPIKRVKKNLLKKVADYLISDSYLFAPLISPQPNTFPSSRVEFREPIKKINNKNVFKEIGEFLISDYYMYASLVAPQSIVTLTEPSWHIKRVTTAVSTRKITMIDKEPTDRSSNKVAKDQSSKNLLHETSISEKTLGHRKMVKHVVYQNCHSTSISALFISRLRGALVSESNLDGFVVSQERKRSNLQLRKLIVDFKTGFCDQGVS